MIPMRLFIGVGVGEEGEMGREDPSVPVATPFAVPLLLCGVWCYGIPSMGWYSCMIAIMQYMALRAAGAVPLLLLLVVHMECTSRDKV